jgi:hypothetical protein
MSIEDIQLGLPQTIQLISKLIGLMFQNLPNHPSLLQAKNLKYKD